MNRIKELRKSRGLTQKEMADILSVADSTFSYWERGIIEINNDSLFRLSDFFEVSIDYLLGRSDNPNPKITISDKLQGDKPDFVVLDGLSESDKAEIRFLVEYKRSQKPHN